MEILTQKTLVKSDTETLSLLYLLGEIGGRHELILIRRRDGRIIEALNYSMDATLALTEEMAYTSPIQCFNDTDLNCPTQKVRAKWVISSGGDLAIELIAERTTIHRRSGDWTINFQQVKHENAVDSSAAPTSSAIVSTSRACAIV